MDTECSDEPLLHEQVAFDREDGFIDFLARRLCVESSEARARLSAWLTAYEPPRELPRRSGVHATPQEDNETEELTQSA